MFLKDSGKNNVPLYRFSIPPTAFCCESPSRAILDERAPQVVAWIRRMLEPKAEGSWEPLEALLPTLKPLLETQVADLFLPWSAANARAIASGDSEFSVELAGRHWEQVPQKYHARSLKALRDRYAGVSDATALDPILEETGCLAWLRDG